MSRTTFLLTIRLRWLARVIAGACVFLLNGGARETARRGHPRQRPGAELAPTLVKLDTLEAEYADPARTAWSADLMGFRQKVLSMIWRQDTGKRDVRPPATIAPIPPSASTECLLDSWGEPLLAGLREVKAVQCPLGSESFVAEPDSLD